MQCTKLRQDLTQYDAVLQPTRTRVNKNIYYVEFLPGEIQFARRNFQEYVFLQGSSIHNIGTSMDHACLHGYNNTYCMLPTWPLCHVFCRIWHTHLKVKRFLGCIFSNVRRMLCKSLGLALKMSSAYCRVCAIYNIWSVHMPHAVQITQIWMCMRACNMNYPCYSMLFCFEQRIRLNAEAAMRLGKNKGWSTLAW